MPGSKMIEWSKHGREGKWEDKTGFNIYKQTKAHIYIAPNDKARPCFFTVCALKSIHAYGASLQLSSLPSAMVLFLLQPAHWQVAAAAHCCCPERLAKRFAGFGWEVDGQVRPVRPCCCKFSLNLAPFRGTPKVRNNQLWNSFRGALADTLYWLFGRLR